MADQKTQTQSQTSSATATTSKMDELLENSPEIFVPKLGELVDGKVINIYRNQVLVDLGGTATGIISGRETKDSDDTIKSLAEGDTISASVVEEEDSEGLIVLSLRKASQEKTWRNFINAHEEGTVIEVKVNEANKGGLLLDIDGIKGFIPVSQLAPLHYPRVNGADAQKILMRLQKLVGEVFKVKVINVDKENGKLILSEKSAFDDERKSALGGLKVGEKVKGKISGIVNFGIFVAFNGLEGLVHISEIAWGHVSNPADHGKLGDEVEVLVIGIEGEKISLSMKRLTQDPWIEAAKTFSIGKIVKGEINRITQFGAFMKLNNEINGLIHISEISPDPIKEINDTLKIGDKVEAKIITVDLDDHRIGLSIKALKEPAKKEKPAEEEVKEAPEKADKEEKTEKKEEKTEEKPAEKKEETATEKPEEKTETKEEKAEAPAETAQNVEDLKGVTAKNKKTLVEAGFKTLEDLKKAKVADLNKLDGIGPKTAEKIIALAG